MKRLLPVLLAMAMMLSLVACQSGQTTTQSTTAGKTDSADGKIIAADGKKYTLKMSYSISETETVPKVAKEMAADILEITDGHLILENYGSGELAGDVDQLELAASGANILTFGTPDLLASYIPDLGILDGPYMFLSPEEFSVLEKSDWFKEKRTELEAKGIKNLSISWYFGPRHLIHSLNKQVKTPDDIKGATLRSAASPMRLAMMNAMSGNTTTVSWTEIYSALSQGVADGCEAPLSSIYSSKLQEVCKDISLTSHINAIWSVNISAEYFKSLPTAYQNLLVEKIEEYGKKSIEAVKADQKALQATLEAEGVRFTDVDVESFKKATSSAYAEVKDYTDGLYEKLQGILGH